MSLHPQKKQVANLLSKLKYKDKSAVEKQILNLLHQIHSLQPRVDNYTFNDGTIQQLFKLKGTIPIEYKSNKYNIPITLWLPLNFPANCPICYVVPTSKMKIKEKHLNVDNNGLIYHPYLYSWTYNRSTLIELIGVLCSMFGSKPPLYEPTPSNIQQQQSNDAKSILERKLRKHLNHIYDDENKKLNNLASAQQALENQQSLINYTQCQQNTEQQLLLQRRKNLKIKTEAIQQWLKVNANNNIDEIDVNEIVIASDLWSKQCMESVAMDSAITDVLLEWDGCLEDEAITLETYLKQISKLARQQFAYRALAMEVYKKQNNLVSIL